MLLLLMEYLLPLSLLARQLHGLLLLVNSNLVGHFLNVLLRHHIEVVVLEVDNSELAIVKLVLRKAGDGVHFKFNLARLYAHKHLFVVLVEEVLVDFQF